MLKEIALISSSHIPPTHTPVTPATYSGRYEQVVVGLLNGNLLVLLTLSGTAIYKYFIQPSISRWKHSLSKTLKLQRTIEGILYQAMDHYGADRVILACPHNGTVFSNKVHMWKISAWLEVTAPGVRDTRDELQAIPLSKIEDYLETLESAKFIHSSVTSASQGDFLTDYYTRNGVDSCIHIILQSGDSIDGILCIHNPSVIVEEPKYSREILSLLRSTGGAWISQLISKMGG